MSLCQTSPNVVFGTAAAIPSPERKAFSLALFVFMIAYTLFCLSMFQRYRNTYARMRVRHVYYQLCYAMALVSFACSQLPPEFVGYDPFPCAVPYTLAILMMMFFTVVNITRNTSFVMMTRLAKATYLHGRIPLEKTAEEERRLRALPWRQKIRAELALLGFAMKFILRPESSLDTLTPDEHFHTLRTIRVLTSARGLFMLSLMIALPWSVYLVITVLLVPEYGNNCYGCPPVIPAGTSLVLASSVPLLLVAVYFSIKCRDMPDNWGLFFEGRLSAIGMFAAVLGLILFQWNATPGGYSHNLIIVIGFTWGISCGTVLQIALAVRGDQEMKSFNVKRGGRGGQEQGRSRKPEDDDVGSQGASSVLENTVIVNCPRLTKILSSPALLKAFELHLSHEFASENLLFLNDALHWREQFDSVTFQERVREFMHILDTYVSSRGLYQVNLPSNLSRDLLAQSTSSEAELEKTVFDPARQEISRLLELGPCARFAQSNEYQDIVTGGLVIQQVTESI